MAPSTTIHLSAVDGRSSYVDVELAGGRTGGDVREQAEGIAVVADEALARTSGEHASAWITRVDVVPEPGLATNLCTVVALLPGGRVIAIPCGILWTTDGVRLQPDARTPAPWTSNFPKGPSIDWDRVRKANDGSVPRRPVEVAPPEDDGTGAVSISVEPALDDEAFLASIPDPDPLPSVRVPRVPLEATGRSAPDLMAVIDSATAPSRRPAKPAAAVAEPAPAAAMPGMTTLQPLRRIAVLPGVPSMTVLEKARAAGSELLDWNTHAHIVRQYEPLCAPVPLLGGPMIEFDDGEARLATLLRASFPWLSDAVDCVNDACRMQLVAGRDWFRIEPVILVGPPGSGKSSFVARMARLLGVGHSTLDCSASADSVTLAGTPRGFSTSNPGLALVTMERRDCANPVLQIDEIDKATRSPHGYIPDALLGMTEPATASRYFDQCLQRHADLTACSWVATANDASRIGAPLRSRFRVIRAPRPGPEHLEAVVAGVAEEVATQWDMPADRLAPITGASADLLRESLRTGSLRTTATMLRQLWSRDLADNGRPGVN